MLQCPLKSYALRGGASMSIRARKTERRDFTELHVRDIFVDPMNTVYEHSAMVESTYQARLGQRH